MGEKISFATTNWKDKPGKPPGVTQAEWDAYNSSKFNGFPFATVEKDEEGNAFSNWDKKTKFQNKPSKYANRRVSVLGNHYSYEFTFDQLFQLFWRMSHARPTLMGVNVQEGYSEISLSATEATNYRESSYQVTNGSLITTSTSNRKELESKLIEELPTNYWTLDINGCKITIDFTMPVLKMGENKFRPFVNCECCNCDFTAFHPSIANQNVDPSLPIENIEKFKYFTYETTKNYSVGSFDNGLQSGWWDCGPGPFDENTVCSPFRAWQGIISESLNLKVTMRLKPQPWGCECEVVKATGSSSSSTIHYIGDELGGDWGQEPSGGTDWSTGEITDAIWSTTTDEEGNILLDQKISDAKWHWTSKLANSEVVQADIPVSCFESSGSNYHTRPCEPNSCSWAVFTVLEWLESGALKEIERTITESVLTYSGAGPSHPGISYPVNFHYKWKVHDTLKEVWGDGQEEMKPLL